MFQPERASGSVLHLRIEMSRKNLGSSIDDFLKGEKMFEEVQAQAIKEVVS